ncbi:hypothetical protein GF358_00085 [Candidatus Woesearchaeota archaeon]|nr:hypothetical protein [Candidatus Woesearchaeota archaeon]
MGEQEDVCIELCSASITGRKKQYILQELLDELMLCEDVVLVAGGFNKKYFLQVKLDEEYFLIRTYGILISNN